MTIDEVLWSDDARLQEPLRSTWAERDLVLFAHVAEWSGFHALKRFTLDADKWFYLEAPGHPTVEAMALTGGVTTKDGGIRYVTLRILSDEEMDRSVEYTLRPRNKTSELAWSVQASVMPPAM